MKRGLLLVVLAAGIVALAAPVRATIITFDLDQVFSGDAPQATQTPDKPWLQASFEDEEFTIEKEGKTTTIEGVRLTMTTPNLTGDEFVGGWYFNFNPDKNKNLFEFRFTPEGDGPEARSFTLATNGPPADGGGRYNILFKFPDSNAGDARFTKDETSIYLLSLCSGESLTALDFNFPSTPPAGNGTWYSAAHIQAIGENGGSGWIGARPVPEPATLLLLGCGLIILAGIGRRKLMQ